MSAINDAYREEAPPPQVEAAPALTAPATPQISPYEERMQQASAALQGSNWDESIRLVQEAISHNASNPKGYALLGVAYLYGKKNVNAAATAYRGALEHNGAVPFLVNHDHGQMPVFSNVCEGKLFVTPLGLTFQSADSTHNFEVAKKDLNEIATNGVMGVNVSAFHLKVNLPGGKPINYNFAPGSGR